MSTKNILGYLKDHPVIVDVEDIIGEWVECEECGEVFENTITLMKHMQQFNHYFNKLEWMKTGQNYKGIF